MTVISQIDHLLVVDVSRFVLLTKFQRPATLDIQSAQQVAVDGPGCQAQRPGCVQRPIVVSQAFLQRMGRQRFIAGGQRIAEGGLVKQGGQRMKGAFGGRRVSRFQGNQRAAMEDAAAGLAAGAVNHFANIVMGQGVRSPRDAALRQQTGV